MAAPWKEISAVQELATKPRALRFGTAEPVSLSHRWRLEGWAWVVCDDCGQTSLIAGDLPCPARVERNEELSA